MKKWGRRFVKIGFILFAFLAVILTIMINMGGNSDTLKGALEDYLSQASGGQPATIETLNKMTFYPYIGVDIDGITIQPQTATTPTITVEKANIAISFWDVISSSRSFKTLDIQNVVFAPGSIAEDEITIKDIAIDEDANGQAFLDINGTLAAHKFALKLDLETHGKKYQIGKESNFTANLGALETAGTLRPRALGGFHIRDFTIAHRDVEIMAGTLSFVRDGGKNLDLQGDLLIPEHGTKTALDVNLSLNETRIITGDMNAEFLATADFTPTTRLAAALADWNAMIKSKGETDIDIAIEADLFAKNGQQTPDYRGNLTRNGATLIFTKDTP